MGGSATGWWSRETLSRYWLVRIVGADRGWDSETLFKRRSPALAAAPADITSSGYLGRGSSCVLADIADCEVATYSRSRADL